MQNRAETAIAGCMRRMFQKRLLQDAAEELLCKLHEKGMFGIRALEELINAAEKNTYMRAMPLLVMWKYGNESNASGQCGNT